MGMTWWSRRCVTRSDSVGLKWLTGVELAETRDEKLAWSSDQPVVCWRVSVAGRDVRVPTWRDGR